MLFCLLNFLVLSEELTLSQAIFTCFTGSSRSTESSTSASLSATPSQDGGTSSQSDQQQRPLLAKTSVSSSNPNESLESPSAVQAAMATVNSRRNVSYSKIQTMKISNREIFTLLKSIHCVSKVFDHLPLYAIILPKIQVVWAGLGP